MDWTDVLIHAGMSACIVFIAALLGVNPFLVAGLVAAGWAGREAAQDRAKRGYWRSPGNWSTQKHLEWFGALIAGLIVAVLAALVR